MEYNLNVNWLITGEERMFSDDEGKMSPTAELLHMMRMPAIEQVIFARMLEIKCLLKEEVDEFFQQKAAKNSSGSR
ncbi:MAG: hypothetical protein GY765_21865 [bacterium]|nr:hypothetical protein [bacterium]